jgi:hypothetical protein
VDCGRLATPSICIVWKSIPDHCELKADTAKPTYGAARNIFVHITVCYAYKNDLVAY